MCRYLPALINFIFESCSELKGWFLFALLSLEVLWSSSSSSPPSWCADDKSRLLSFWPFIGLTPLRPPLPLELDGSIILLLLLLLWFSFKARCCWSEEAEFAIAWPSLNQSQVFARGWPWFDVTHSSKIWLPAANGWADEVEGNRVASKRASITEDDWEACLVGINSACKILRVDSSSTRRAKDGPFLWQGRVFGWR